LRTLRRHIVLAAVTGAVLGLAPAAQALDFHAHRGGGLTNGRPAALENALSTFKTAPKRGADVVELDVHVSKDGVPFVIHDGTLDRTTDCEGPVGDASADKLDTCHVDALGTTDVFKSAPGSSEAMPRLAEVLRWAKADGVRLNIEINHYPNEPSFDTTDTFVNAELDAIDKSGIPKSQVLLQSFLPDNLTPAKARGYRTALITFTGANSQALTLAQQGGFDVLEPQWPVDAAFVRNAHAAGRQVIPYTLDTVRDVADARAAKVDGLITDDLPAARQGLKCYAAEVKLRAASRKVAAAKKAAKKAHGKKAKKRAAKKVKAATKAEAAARRARSKACG
jgi:glycerophosphoryl diester phosphodiesterase